MHDHIGKALALVFSRWLVRLRLELVQDVHISFANDLLRVRHIIVAVLIKDVALMLVHVLPLIVISAASLLIEPGRALELSYLLLGLATHLPFLLFLEDALVPLRRSLVLICLSFGIGFLLGDVFALIHATCRVCCGG